jgi:hypothetical protein
VYLGFANSVVLAVFAFIGINNLHNLNRAFSSIPTAPPTFQLKRQHFEDRATRCTSQRLIFMATIETGANESEPLLRSGCDKVVQSALLPTPEFSSSLE